MDVSRLKGALAFLPQERVLFGQGAADRLASEVDRLGRQRAFVITGTTRATKTGLLERVRQILGPRFAGAFYPVSQHVPRRDVLSAAFRAREVQADILISLGGGSPVDGTKAVALCLSEGVVSEEQLECYRVRGPGGVLTTPRFQGQAVPHIALSTTLSAAEFTSGFGITDETRRVKEGYGALPLAPRVVILDPELTVPTPPWLWSATGMRAVDHAIERLYSLRHQPFVDTLCLQSLRYLFRHLPSSTRDRQDLEAGLYCQFGAWMSIFGAMSVRTGISHAIGHQLGAHCNVAHGQTSCILLPAAMDFNLPAAADRLALVAECAGMDIRGRSTGEAAQAAIEMVRRFIKDLGCPTRLRDVGVEEADLRPIAEAVMEEVPFMENPLPIKAAEDVLEILQHAW